MRLSLTYFAGLLTLILGDLFWLGFIMRDFYTARLGHLMAPDVTWWAAILFYLTYTFGVYWFVVAPSSGKGMTHLARQGALYGALGYSVYDLTNQATLQGWQVQVTLLDIAWGAFLTMLVSVVMAKASIWFSSRD